MFPTRENRLGCSFQVASLWKSKVTKLNFVFALVKCHSCVSTFIKWMRWGTHIMLAIQGNKKPFPMIPHSRSEGWHSTVLGPGCLAGRPSCTSLCSHTPQGTDLLNATAQFCCRSKSLGSYTSTCTDSQLSQCVRKCGHSKQPPPCCQQPVSTFLTIWSIRQFFPPWSFREYSSGIRF